MKLATYVGLFDELHKLKTAEWKAHALEVGGLGLLAAPTAYKAITGKKVSDRTTHAAELGGLGVLAAHPAHALGKAAIKGVKGLMKRGSAEVGFLEAALSLFRQKQDI